MSTKTLTGLALIAAAALLCAACAPAEPPAPPGNEAPGPAVPPDAEQLAHMPTPAPQPAGPRQRIEAAIEHVRRRDLRTDNAFWTVFHGILGLGPTVTLLNPMTGQRVNAVEYICGGGEMRGLQFNPTKYGLDVQTFAGGQGVGQGHQDQFVAEMAQWGMPADREFLVLGKEYTFMDFVRHTQMRASVTRNQELSWAVLVIGQYLGTDAAWTNGYGEKLRLEDLVRYELDASVEQAPCGGTHRLFGLTWVYHLHLQKGGQKVENAANALALMVLDLQDSPIEGGSLYHAVHGLLIYYARVHDRKWLGPNDPLIPLPRTLPGGGGLSARPGPSPGAGRGCCAGPCPCRRRSPGRAPPTPRPPAEVRSTFSSEVRPPSPRVRRESPAPAGEGPARRGRVRPPFLTVTQKEPAVQATAGSEIF
jgi:hypothetical protein